MTNSIFGVIPPMTTPFDKEGEIDYSALREDVEYLIEEAKIHGIAVGGSTGEGHTLSQQELRQIVETAVDQTNGRVPVIAGIIVDSTKQAVESADSLNDLEVAALQVTPVHYLFKPHDDALFQHFATMANSTHIPIIIYNVVPWVYLSPQLLTRIITQVPGVIGVKQSAGDLKTLADLMILLEGKGKVFAATDALLYPAYTLGAHGSIAAILQAAPKLSAELWEAVQSGNHSLALNLHKKLLAIWNAIEGDNLPANVKTAMRLNDRNGGFPRAPMPVSSNEQETQIKKAIR